jgi:hypothetical protein
MRLTNEQTKDLLSMVPLGPLLVAISNAEDDRESRGKSNFLPEHCDRIVAAFNAVKDSLAEIHKDDILRCRR